MKVKYWHIKENGWIVEVAIQTDEGEVYLVFDNASQAKRFANDILSRAKPLPILKMTEQEGEE